MNYFNKIIKLRDFNLIAVGLRGYLQSNIWDGDITVLQSIFTFLNASYF